MVNIEEILKKEGRMLKLTSVAPEGFVLVHEDTLNELKDFETWKSWKNNELTIKELNNKNFK